MTTYTAKNIILKNAGGEYLIPYTNKQDPITGAASTITSNDLTASRVLVSDANGKVSVSTTASAEMDYLSGVTSNIQTQLDNRVTLDTAQTISAIKTFSAVPVMTGTLNAKDNSTNVATTAWVRNHCCTTAATTSSTASKDAPAYVVTNYKSGNNWYRVWSDGWIEQGGYLSAGADSTATFSKAFTTTNYNVQVTGIDASQGYSGYIFIVNSRTKTNMHVQTLASGSTATYVPKNWCACGY